MKYIVTGGAGFIGSHITNRLLDDGHEVVVIDDLSTGFRKYLPIHKCLTFLQLDISDWNSLSKNHAYFKGVNGVFHLSACARIQPSIYDPSRTHEVNVTGTLNILEIMRMMNIKNIVFSSSSSIYGKNKVPLKENMVPNCLNPYSVSKLIGEEYIKTWGELYGINGISLRYYNVYGPREVLEGPYAPVIGLFFRQTLKDRTSMTIIGDGEQRRDFTSVHDVVEANVLAMNECVFNGAIGRVLNIGSGKSYSINEVATIVFDAIMNFSWFKDSVAATIGIKYVPERPGECRETLAAIMKAETFLNWEPKVTFQDGVDELVGHYFRLMHAGLL